MALLRERYEEREFMLRGIVSAETWASGGISKWLESKVQWCGVCAWNPRREPPENHSGITPVSSQCNLSFTGVSPRYRSKGGCTELSQALCDFQVAGEGKSADVRRWSQRPHASAPCSQIHPDLYKRWDGTFFLLPMQTTWLFRLDRSARLLSEQILVSFGTVCKNDQYIKFFSWINDK